MCFIFVLVKPQQHSTMINVSTSIRLFVCIFFINAISSIANAQALNTKVTIDLDYCTTPNQVTLKAINLPSGYTNIQWYEVDNANNA
ncbi:MAG: hypothetical protein ACK5MI_10110, partial [Mangrovibacterium sp.]